MRVRSQIRIAGLGWSHCGCSSHKAPSAGNITIDLWPEMSEYDADERFATGFTNADGTPAEVFSSYRRKTVVRHFEWMRDYGIDGAFVQRFANGLSNSKLRKHKDVVLSNARVGAKRAGRAYAVMYDLSGLRAGGTAIVREDWLRLRREIRLTGEGGRMLRGEIPVTDQVPDFKVLP